MSAQSDADEVARKWLSEQDGDSLRENLAVLIERERAETLKLATKELRAYLLDAENPDAKYVIRHCIELVRALSTRPPKETT